MKPSLFFKNLLRLLLLNALIKPLWVFGVDRQVQNVVGHEAYGTYFSLLNLSLVFSFLTDAGLSNLMNRQVAAGTPPDTKQLLRVKAALAAVYSVLVMATAWVAGVQQWRLLLLIIATQVLLSFFTFLRSLITAHQAFRWEVWLSVIDKVLMLLLFLPLLYGSVFQIPISVLFFARAQLFCTALATAIGLLLVLGQRLLQPTAPIQSMMVVLKNMAPYALLILAMSAHNRLDGFLLERLYPDGAQEAGVYAAAYRLLDAANMMGYLVASFLVPFLARHRGNKMVVQHTIAAAQFGLLLFGLFASLFVTILAQPVQQLLYPGASAHTARVLQWCLPVLPAYLLLQVYGSLLTAMGQLKPFLLCVAVAVGVNLFLNLALIPMFGAVGCCVAALASQYVCAITVYLTAMRKNSLAHERSQALLLIVMGLLLASLFYAGRAAVHPLLLALIGSGVVGLAVFSYLPRLKQSLILSR